MATLTKRQDRFAQRYALHGNAAQAHREAEYKRVSAEQHRTLAYRLLQKAHIQERVEHYRDLIDRKLDVRTDRILMELAAVAFLDPLDVIDERTVVEEDEDGALVPTGRTYITVRSLRDIPKHARVAISEVKQDPDGSIRVRFHSKIQALREIAEIKGLRERSDGRSPNRRVAAVLRLPKVG